MRALLTISTHQAINSPFVLELLRWRAEQVAGHAYENNISGITSDTTSCTSETGNANLGPYRSRLGGVCVLRHDGLELLIPYFISACWHGCNDHHLASRCYSLSCYECPRDGQRYSAIAQGHAHRRPHVHVPRLGPFMDSLGTQHGHFVDGAGKAP